MRIFFVLVFLALVVGCTVDNDSPPEPQQKLEPPEDTQEPEDTGIDDLFEEPDDVSPPVIPS